jgi:nucleoside 2-deoxyribosyltransferase
MKIYVASSWRNEHQPAVVQALRDAGHDVYDFKNPEPGNNGFHWSEIDPDWQSWTTVAFRGALEHTVAKAGFERDMTALEGCDICVLVLPCGRSAHLELGFAAGAGKPTLIYITEPQEPELMYKMVDCICTTMEELLQECASYAYEVDGQKCRVCGCTDAHACPGGCYWVTDDLCSSCAETKGER